MDFDKWLKRKFPESYEVLLRDYDRETLKNFLKEYKYNVGYLKEKNGDNMSGDLVLYKRTKEIIEENQNGYEYPNEGGWTGAFEFRYCFSKRSDMLYPISFRNLCK